MRIEQMSKDAIFAFCIWIGSVGLVRLLGNYKDERGASICIEHIPEHLNITKTAQLCTSAAAQRCVWRTTKYLTNEGSCGRAERHHSPLVSFWCTSSTLVQVVFSVPGYYLQTVQALVQQSVAWKMVNTLVRAHICILSPTTVAKPHPDKSNQQANKAADLSGQEKSGVKSWDGRQQQIHSLGFFPNWFFSAFATLSDKLKYESAIGAHCWKWEIIPQRQSITWIPNEGLLWQKIKTFSAPKTYPPSPWVLLVDPLNREGLSSQIPGSAKSGLIWEAWY